MMRIKLVLLLISQCFINLALISQDIELQSSYYLPASPYGGVKELQAFVKQEMVYPEQALKNQTDGQVFISFVVDENGHIVSQSITDYGKKELGKEASRVFKKIVWMPNKARKGKTIEEKIMIEFKVRKYKRLVKKRGYDQLPRNGFEQDTSEKVYTPNQIQEKPHLVNNQKINQFVAQNIKYPSVAHQQGLSGRVTAEFIVEPYGMASNIRIREALGGGCNEETIRLIKAMKWVPGLKDGKAIRTLFSYQLNFVHPGGTVR